MKQIFFTIIVLGVVLVVLSRLQSQLPSHTFRTYTDPASGFSFEYPHELVATPLPSTDGESQGVSFGDTVGGPFLISVQSMSTAEARARTCTRAYEESPDNDPGFQQIQIDRAGRSLVITSRSTSAFLRIQRAVDLQ